MKHGHPEFYKILDELGELHSIKNRQYATQDTPLGNFNRCADLMSKLFSDKIPNKPLAVAMALMAKQVDGVYEMVGEDKKDTPDELEDKFKDMAIYSIICMVLIREYERES